MKLVAIFFIILYVGACIGAPQPIGTQLAAYGNDVLKIGECLLSPDRSFCLVQEPTGNMAIYYNSARPGAKIGNFGATSTVPGIYATYMQWDGNLCTHRTNSDGSTTPIWCAFNVARPAGNYTLEFSQPIDVLYDVIFDIRIYSAQRVIEYISGFLQANKPTFSYLVSSDPQVAWHDGNRTLNNILTYADIFQPKAPCSENNYREYGKKIVEHQYNSMAILSQTYPIRAVIVNGDLTAFGHDWQYNSFRNSLRIFIEEAGLPYYLGLGNHDYQNNLGDCGLPNGPGNPCTARMLYYMYDHIQSLSSGGSIANLANKDVYRSNIIYYEGLRRRWYEGSFSYSWNNGPFHFVQLQNHPDYNTHFYNWYVGDGGYRAYYNITKSLEWLENDLEAHKDSHIILNFHVNTFSAGLQTLLSKYKVAAIFVGHIHERLGLHQWIELGNSFRVPVFYSGSATWKDYLKVDFNPKDRSFVVHQVTNVGCIPNPTTVPYTISRACNCTLSETGATTCVDAATGGECHKIRDPNYWPLCGTPYPPCS